MNLTTPDRPVVLVHDRVTGRLMRVPVEPSEPTARALNRVADCFDPGRYTITLQEAQK